MRVAAIILYLMVAFGVGLQTAARREEMPWDRVIAGAIIWPVWAGLVLGNGVADIALRNKAETAQ